MIAALTVYGEAHGSPSRYSAAAPATCGEAMEVPSMVFVPPYSHAEVIPSPGANRSTHGPKLVNHEACWSHWLLAATVSASGERAGDQLQASSEALAAATATVTPDQIRFWMASSTAWLAHPASDRLATAGVPCVHRTQSMPAITSDQF